MVDAALKSEPAASATEKVESGTDPGDITSTVATPAHDAAPLSASDGSDAAPLAAPAIPSDVIAVAIASVQATPASTQQRPMTIAKRWPLAIIVGAIVLLAIVLIGVRACGSKHASPPRASNREAAPSRLTLQAPANAEQVVATTPVLPAAPVATDVAEAPSAQASEEKNAPETDEVRIQVVVKPDGTAFYHKGKVIGRTPFILKQPREKRTYEVVKSGYGARRLVVTGNEKIIGFELHQEVPHPDSL
jgi:hypothetical protein